jgi:outer membrane lipoprotein carrier protein
MKPYLLLLIFTASLAIVVAAPAPLSAPVKSWLAAQTNLHTWSADLTQTRTLQSLTAPLTSAGRVWFAAPDRFRWELGQPPETIAVCTGTNLLILYPRLKRVEKIPLTGERTSQWRSALDMLEAGFPSSEAQLQKRYRILSQTVTNQTCELQLHPRSTAIQQMVPRIEIDFDTNNDSLRSTELEFSGGSTLRNDFHNIVLNPTLPKTIFAPSIPKNYTVATPLKKQ